MERNWSVLFRLVRAKKGIREAEMVEEYLKEVLEVSELTLATQQEVQGTIRRLSGMPDVRMQ